MTMHSPSFLIAADATATEGLSARIAMTSNGRQGPNSRSRPRPPPRRTAPARLSGTPFGLLEGTRGTVKTMRLGGKAWLLFTSSVVIAPLLGFFRAPQNAYWFFLPRSPIAEHLGYYFALASIPPALGLAVAVFGLASRRYWGRFGISCAFNLVWLLLSIAMIED